MSCAEARRRCPDAIFVRPEMARYRAHSVQVWDLVRSRIHAVEQVGIDEGYLDLSTHARTVGEIRAVLSALADALRDECGLDASFGVGTSKTVAKIASDQDKPRGMVIIPPGREAAFLAPLPVRALPGVGPVTAERLAEHGITLIGQLAALDDAAVAPLLRGAHGTDIHRRANGVDPRPVNPEPAVRVSIGHETTFEEDIADPALLSSHVEQLVARVAERLHVDGRACGTVTVKLRYPDFSLLTRACSTAHPTVDPTEISRLADLALDRALAARPGPVRLLGVSLSRLGQGGQLQLAH
jgi:DNA polymerase-4